MPHVLPPILFIDTLPILYIINKGYFTGHAIYSTHSIGNATYPIHYHIRIFNEHATIPNITVSGYSMSMPPIPYMIDHQDILLTIPYISGYSLDMPLVIYLYMFVHVYTF